MKTLRTSLLWLALFSCFAPAFAARVKVMEQDIVIPTYLAGEPEPNPMFYFGRQSQGAEGRVYPYPLYDTLTHVKSNKTYRMVYLENEYVRIGVLPEIGGRLFEAVDKSNGYDFVYRQHVIKPALIGLIGAWISGGIEWNIPHHHRASTFLPVQHRVERNRDGSATIWVGELEVRHRTRWAVGYTLHPGRSYLECKLRIMNRTPFVQSMLAFANVAVHVDEHYQVIFPPATEHVTFHHKREFTTWPIATGRFSGADFGNGVDVSWYSNHIAANSMFAWNYTDDFFAGYDHGKQAGTMSVADHHVVPGKKFWTWGNGPRGRMWDRILTDDDGPYIELMVGAYSDNQPDYSWLQPYETRAFEMYWYPFRDIGGVKNANLDAAVNLDVSTHGIARVGFCTTSAHRKATVLLEAGGRVLLSEQIGIDPGRPFLREVGVPAGVDPHDVRASLVIDGKTLIAYSPLRPRGEPMPPAVQDPPAPERLETVEELYLAGLRIEQFHAPSLEPEPYWEEALQRDPGDVRVNTAMGVRLLKKARFADAEKLFRKALERATAKYTTAKDAEPLYYLGLALKAQGRHDEAFDSFYKATWSAEWKGPAHFALAEVASRRGDPHRALDFVERALESNGRNVRALTLKASLLRHLKRIQEARAELELAQEQTDPLDVRIIAERWLAGERRARSELDAVMREHPHTGLEVAAEYGNAGLWRDGTEVLTRMIDATPDRSRVSPLAYYYLAQFAERLGDAAGAAEFRLKATQMSPDYVFPFQWEAIHVLRRAIEMNPQDARAPYYLGNLLFDWQPDEAVRLWEQAARLDPAFPIVHRNLATAYAHQQPNRLDDAIASLERATAGPTKHALHFAELDELYARTGAPAEKRLALLERNHEIVVKRDDALSRDIGLKVFAGKHDEAIALMTGRVFAVWEGGSLDVADHWVNAHLLRARENLGKGEVTAALADLRAARTIPDNLPSDQRGGGRTAEMAWWLGAAHEAAGDLAKARVSWLEAVETSAPGRRRDADGRALSRQVQSYYQALARRKLGDTADGDTIFRGMMENAQRSLDQDADSASGSQGRMNQTERKALAHYVAGLAHLGLGDREQAQAAFEKALEAAPDSLGPKTELEALRGGGS